MQKSLTDKNLESLFKFGCQTLENTKDYDRAIKIFAECVNNDHKNPNFWAQLGLSYMLNREMSMANECLTTSLHIDPLNIETNLRIALFLYENGEINKSIDYFKKCLSLDSNNIWAKRNLAFIRLQLNFLDKENLDFFEKVRDKTSNLNQSNIPLINLQKNHLKNSRHKKLFIINEDGFGDDIMFLRYISILKDYGFKISLSAHKKIISLLKTSPYLNNVDINSKYSNASILDHDFKTNLMSLPYILSEKINFIPQPLPLNLKKNRIVLGKSLVKQIKIKKIRIGLSWRGNPSHSRDKIRSIPIEFFSTIFKQFENCKFFIIQKNLNTKETNFLSHFKNVFNCDEFLDDFSKTAMLVSNMDQVISVDTVLAHLAGTMSIPTTLLLPKIPDWRWGLSGNKTDWYPSIYILRQNSIDCWDKVFESLAFHLSKNF